MRRFFKALRKRPRALIGAGALAAILVALFLYFDKPAARTAGFYLWRFASGQAHGGQCVEIKDVCIYYETFGAGPPVLVLHSGLGSLNTMKFQIRALSASHLVIAADSRGHGRSTDSDAPFSYSLMADDMLALLDRLGIERTDIVGLSDGANIGLELAMRHPDRVNRLVAISGNYDPDGVIGLPAADLAAPGPPFGSWLFGIDAARWAALFRKDSTMWRTQPHYSLNDLARIKAPTLVISSAGDIIKREHTDQLAKAIPNSREVIIEGGTHSAAHDNPEVVNPIILQFLNQS
jgi:pimeloyl-ACP methyl ester carboxylesterase